MSMNDTNIQSESKCPDCTAYERKIDKMDATLDNYGQQIERLEAENKGLASLLNRLQSEVLQLDAENKDLREALNKTHQALLTWTSGRAAITNPWPESKEAIESARKLLEP